MKFTTINFNKDTMTSEEVAKALRVDEQSIKRWIDSGKLKAKKVVLNESRRWVVNTPDLEKYLKALN